MIVFIDDHRGVFGVGPICPIGEPGLCGGDAEPALGFRFHLCLKLAGDGLRRLRDRRLRPQDRRLACLNLDDHRLCSRRPEPGHLPADAIRGWRADPSFRPRTTAATRSASLSALAANLATPDSLDTTQPTSESPRAPEAHGAEIRSQAVVGWSLDLVRRQTGEGSAIRR